MAKVFKKLSVALVGIISASMILASCTTAEKIKNDVNQGTNDVKQGAVKGVQDVKEGSKKVGEGAKDIGEDVVDKIKNAKAFLIGSWTGKEDSGDHYKISLYADSTYEVVENNAKGEEKAVYSGKYTVDNSKITLNQEKKREKGKVVEDKKVKKLTYNIVDNKVLKIKDESKKSEISLNRESNLFDKIIK
ncbi:DUF3994 domain-containing protein [Clostridium cylindrosporum]|uniref:DUF3994 domain-containing protein n=1 Tax=Clostridium cylindrosporum DSM 605 TaxID=1121307 RepID=A0A0J8DEJ2_CLOCY|nr:copper resistance protein NlpE N-terminal domain-containing protein [Clostridium cylindrosporum]KMT22654.1 hypothetical protein CLCY_9c00850 [Clostridium cylindrosporum DSM 605]